MVVMLALVIPLLSAVVPIALLAIVILAGKGERRYDGQHECARSEFHCVGPVLGAVYMHLKIQIRNSTNSRTLRD
jgi:hypothetical protein